MVKQVVRIVTFVLYRLYKQILDLLWPLVRHFNDVCRSAGTALSLCPLPTRGRGLRQGPCLPLWTAKTFTLRLGCHPQRCDACCRGLVRLTTRSQGEQTKEDGREHGEHFKGSGYSGDLSIDGKMCLI